MNCYFAPRLIFILYYIILYAANCSDQIHSLGTQIKLAKCCSAEIRRSLNYVIDSRKESIHNMMLRAYHLPWTCVTSNAILLSNYRDINSSLLYVLMHYKIHTAMFKSNKLYLDFTCKAMLALAICSAASLEIQKSGQVNVIQHVVLLGVVVNSTWNDMLFSPACYMHSRAVTMNRSLFSLMAQITEANLESDEQIYNPSIVSLLRKELAGSDSLSNEYSLQGFGLRCTWGNLMRLHFWTSLFLMSYWIINENNTDIFQ